MGASPVIAERSIGRGRGRFRPFRAHRVGLRLLISCGSEIPGPILRERQPAKTIGSQPLPWLRVLGAGVVSSLIVTVSVVSAAQLELGDCRLDDVGIPMRCGTWQVPEDRSGSGNRMIDLRVAVAPSLAGRPLPDPVFVLAGGPGQAASEIASAVLPQMRRLRKQRDIVFVDQRGTGSSHPLDCESEETDLAQAFSAESFPEELLDDCLAGLDADPRMYTTDIAMDDLDEVRAALGYETINLYGGSYGTRAALVYMRRHPESVRAAILDGVAPFDMRLPLHMGEDAQRALDLLFADCAANARCDAAFPDLSARYEGLIARLGARPAKTTVEHPRTGERLEVTINAVVFAGGLRSILYDPLLSSLVPLMISKASDGDFGPFVADLVPFIEGVADNMSQGMFLSVICAEDVPRIDEAELEAAEERFILGRAAAEGISSACRRWPHADLPASYFDEAPSLAPTLVLSGNLDPVTPPRWGELVMKQLPNGRHVIAPGAGHNVLGRGCADRLMAEFVEEADAGELDVSCIEKIKRPPFFLSATGPGP